MHPKDSDIFFMQAALQEAQAAAEKGEIPIGAVIVSNQKIVARAHNQVELLKDPTAHAEILAITAAANHLGSKYLTDCTLYVTLEPCAMCSGALHWSHIKRLVFGAKDPRKGYQAFTPSLLHPKTEVTKDVLSGSCSELLIYFFKKLRNSIL